jgi:hypothetical protein
VPARQELQQVASSPVYTASRKLLSLRDSLCVGAQPAGGQTGPDGVRSALGRRGEREVFVCPGRKRKTGRNS